MAERDVGQGTTIVDAFIGGAQPRGNRQPRLSTGVGGLRGRRRATGAAEKPMALSSIAASLGGRPAPFRGERNQAGAGAYGEKKARMENRHRVQSSSTRMDQLC